MSIINPNFIKRIEFHLEPNPALTKKQFKKHDHTLDEKYLLRLDVYTLENKEPIVIRINPADNYSHTIYSLIGEPEDSVCTNEELVNYLLNAKVIATLEHGRETNVMLITETVPKLRSKANYLREFFFRAKKYTFDYGLVDNGDGFNA